MAFATRLLPFVLISVCLPLIPADAHAAKKKKLLPERIFTAVDAGFGQVACAVINGQLVPGKQKRKKFTATSDGLPKLEKALAKAQKRGKANKIANAMSKLTALTNTINAQTALCAAQPGSGFTPTPSPTPVADEFSLRPLERALTKEDVQYLLEKAGFGLATKDESYVTLATSQGVRALVDEFMRQKSEPTGLLERVDNRVVQAVSPAPPRSRQRQALLDLWLHTNNPYAEKLAFFLLSVWTVAGDLTRPENDHSAFWDYYTRLRQFAADSTDLPSLGVAITRDPLMLRYLNNDENIRDRPNENYARELMELFTMGPRDLDGNANYTETNADGSGDIAVAARMLTGWTARLDFNTGIAHSEYKSHRHANGPHTMFAGTPHQFAGENDADLVYGIFNHHPGVKYYYASEILKEYLTASPPRELIQAFGQVINDNHYQLRPAMAVLLQSTAFYHPNYRNTIPKNSAEYMVEALRLLQLEDRVDVQQIEMLLHAQGMDVNDAPSVFWFPTSTWTGPSVILERINLPSALLGRSDPNGWSASQLLPSGGQTTDQMIAYVAEHLGVSPVPGDVAASLNQYLNTKKTSTGQLIDAPYNNFDPQMQRSKGVGLYYILMSSPAFQLK